MGENGLKNFLEQLRATDEKTKRKIMIITACVCMIIVIYVWLGYFNSLVSVAVQPTSVSNASSADIWYNVKSTAGAFYQKISGAFSSIFEWSKQYKIKP